MGRGADSCLNGRLIAGSRQPGGCCVADGLKNNMLSGVAVAVKAVAH